ncbi:MAG: hypothetical protein AAF799_45110 [Myxococcota bacterium]
MKWPALCGVVLLSAMALGCEAPPERLVDAEPSAGRTAFFDAFGRGAYEELDDIIGELSREHLEGDDVSTSVLAFAHAWKLSEGARQTAEPRVIEHADLAVRFFDEALEASGDDPRLIGFLGSFEAAAGTIHDERAQRRMGWNKLLKARRQWPQWGGFTLGYVATQLDSDERRFRKGIRAFWRNLDACAGERVDRERFELTDELMDAFTSDSDPWNWRACSNTDVVPYNIEGFFLAFGDILAKGGETDDARRMYRIALETEDSETWPHRWLAQSRLDNLEALHGWFNAAIDRTQAVDAERVTMIAGPFACAGCHQAVPSAEEPMRTTPPAEAP